MSSEAQEPIDRSVWPWLLALALVVRITWMWVFEPTPSIADENWYRGTALRMLHRNPSWLWTLDQAVPFTSPPLIPFVYAVAMKLFGDAERTLRLVNVAAGSLLVLPLNAIGQRLGGRRAGILAALLATFHPDLVAHATRMWTEPIYLLIAWTALAVWLVGARTGRVALLVGGLLGLAALTRETGLALPAVPLAASLVSTDAWRVVLRRGALLVVGVALLVLPWNARLRADPHPDGLVARTSAFNLYLGNVGGRVPYKTLGSTDAERSERAMVRVREVISEDPLGWPWHKVERTASRFFAQDTLPVVGLRVPDEHLFHLTARGTWLAEPSVRAALANLAVCFQVIVLALGAAGVVVASGVRARREGLLLLVVVVLATYAPAWLTFAKTRFLLPAVPAFLLGTALLLGRSSREARDVALLRGVLGVAAAVAMASLAVARGI